MGKKTKSSYKSTALQSIGQTSTLSPYLAFALTGLQKTLNSRSVSTGAMLRK